MFKLSTLLSLSAALAITRTSIAQDDLAAMVGLLKIVECLSADGTSLLTDDCKCNDLKGLADMESDIGAQFEDSGLVLQSFKDCCEDGTTNEEYTKCIYNPDQGAGDDSSEDGVDADLPDETVEVEEPVVEEPVEEEEIDSPPQAAVDNDNSSGMSVNFGSSLVILGVGTALASLF